MQIVYYILSHVFKQRRQYVQGWRSVNHPLKLNHVIFSVVFIDKTLVPLDVCSHLIIILRLRYSFPVRISGIFGEFDVVHHADDIRW